MRTCPTCGKVYPNKTSGTCPTDGTLLVSGSEYAAIKSDPLIGTTMVGRYKIVGRVGTGGMGTVYRAEQVGLAREVALKVLKQEASYDRETVARFQREAKAMSMLLHANTVRVFDFGEDPSGHLYLAMELLTGELLTSRSEREGALDVKEAIEIVQQILRSLFEAHSKGLIHRDLKPDNIYLARIEGHAGSIVKVLDFGIAKVFGDGQPMDQLETQAGTVFGTPRYMSPEQAQGKTLDQRSDLYSVGVLLYQLLVGHPPFVDDDAVVVMAKHIRDMPVAPRKAAPARPIPVRLERVVLRALAKDPNARPSTADELDRELSACLADVAVEAKLVAGGRRSADMVFVAGRAVPRSAAIMGASVVGVAVLIAAIAIGTSGSGAAASTETHVVVRPIPPDPTVVALPPPVTYVAPTTRSVVVSSEPPGAERAARASARRPRPGLGRSRRGVRSDDGHPRAATREQRATATRSARRTAWRTVRPPSDDDDGGIWLELRAIRLRPAAAAALILCLACLAPIGDAQDSHGLAVTIGAGGDLLLQPRVVSAARAAIEGFDRVLAPIRVMARTEEIAFANLESPLSEEIAVSSGSPPTLGAPPDVAAALARAGLDVVSLANNHAWDQGARGAALTRTALEAAGVVAVGAGASDTDAIAGAVLTRGALRVAFVAVTLRVNAGPGHEEPRAMIATWDEPRITAALSRARAAADLVVVSIHWSHDFLPAPREEERTRARFLVDAGADVVIGHGPHVLFPVERMVSARGEAVCAYSLGNLVSNQGFAYRIGREGMGPEATWRPEPRDGAWLRVHASIDDGRIAIRSIEAVPLFTYNNYYERDGDLEDHEDIRVQRLADVTDETLRAERRSAIARALGPAVALVDR